MAKTIDQQLSTITREMRLIRGEMQKISDLINADVRCADRLVSVKEAARMLGKSTDYIYDLIHHGRLGSKRSGANGRHGISENELRRYMAS